MLDEVDLGSDYARQAAGRDADGILAKLADYQASGFGTDTRRMWLQAEWAF